MRAVILALGLVTFVGYQETMTAHHSNFHLIGETVIVSYVADPSVGHGQFRLENRGAVAVVAAVESAWLEFGAHRQPLAEVTVFDLDQEQTVNPGGFKVEARATVTFMLGFPKVAYEPRFGESSAVGVRLSVNGAELQALSPIVFQRRIPRNQTGTS